MYEIIISALIGGASAATKNAANDAVKTTYNMAKDYLTKKFSNIDLSNLESKPELEEHRSAMANAIRTSDAGNDQVMIDLANKLLVALQRSETKVPTDLAPGPLEIFLDVEAKVELISKFPLAPCVDIALISVPVLATQLSNSLDATHAESLIQSAGRARILADPEWPEESICVMQYDLTDPMRGLYAYWYPAIEYARKKGPRTLVSFLIHLPLTVWMQSGQEIYKGLKNEYGVL